MKTVKAWCVKSPYEGLLFWTINKNKKQCRDNFSHKTKLSWKTYYRDEGYKVVPVEIKEVSDD